jgi:23S rRNA pseudoU1915 N3-methylase RlmH
MEIGLILLSKEEGIIAKYNDGQIKVIKCIQNHNITDLYKFLKSLSTSAEENFKKSDGLLIGGPDGMKDNIKRVLSGKMKNRLRRTLFVSQVNEGGLYSLIGRT